MRTALRTVLTVGALLAATACASTRTRQAPGEYLDDSVVTARVKTELIGDRRTEAHHIGVETFRGVVQLSGFVDSAGERSEAAAVAAGVPGVIEVRNNLEVKATKPSAGRDLDDSVVTGKVKTALMSSPRTRARQINVTTSAGVVQLSGFVDSDDERMAAAEITRSVGGVLDVRNDLDIKQQP
jgi:hyperosmotically inducible protein